MGRFKIINFVFCAVFLFLFGCDKINFFNPQKKQEVVVSGTVISKVANRPITLEALNREAEALNAAIDATIDANENLTTAQKREQKTKSEVNTREKKIEYLKNVVIRRMVFAQAALDRGLDRRDDVGDLLKISRDNILAQEMENEVVNKIDVTQTDLEAAYKSIKDQLRQPEARKIRVIVTKTEPEAKQIYQSLLQDADFATLAKSNSISASAKDSGDLGFIGRGKVGGVFDDIAFSPGLQQSSISGIFKGPEGYTIVKIEGIKEGKQLSLQEVSGELKDRLLGLKKQDEMEKFYDTVSRDSIKIEIHESLIK